MTDLRTDDFDYSLPDELIAQHPAERRDTSRLMVLDRSTRSIAHSTFASIADFLSAGDLLIANRSRVIPARIMAQKETGGSIELLLLRRCSTDSWSAMARPSRRLRPDMRLVVTAGELHATLERGLGDGRWLVRFESSSDVERAVHDAGSVPLPPYIRTPDAPADRYQTVYADREGSIAAPTAGLHFTPELIKDLRTQAIAMEYVTLHVGIGTFRPVKSEFVADHRMHSEWGEVPAGVAEAVNTVRAAGSRAVAVGTTSTRLLESAWRDGSVHPFRGETDRFIVPGYEFRAINGLITNFHLPRSTLLMLVSAFAGHDLIRDAYAEAITQRYRFYSFGDAMLIV